MPGEDAKQTAATLTLRELQILVLLRAVTPLGPSPLKSGSAIRRSFNMTYRLRQELGVQPLA